MSRLSTHRVKESESESKESSPASPATDISTNIKTPLSPADACWISPGDNESVCYKNDDCCSELTCPVSQCK